jgi:hypothetical protein
MGRWYRRGRVTGVSVRAYSLVDRAAARLILIGTEKSKWTDIDAEL